MYENLWVDKYKQQKLKDIVGNNLIINKLKQYVKLKNIPNIIFIGKSGIGKTSCAITIIKEMFPKIKFKPWEIGITKIIQEYEKK